MNTIPFEVSIDYPLFQSNNGFYFIGQTPFLNGPTGNALGLLYNPSDSGRLLYVNAITITNLSTESLVAEFYLGTLSYRGQVSNLVSGTNTAICPIIPPNGTIEYFTPPIPTPPSGIPIFTRVVPPRSTLVVDGGQIILGQSQALSVFIGGAAPVSFEGIRFAFGWSEQEIERCN